MLSSILGLVALGATAVTAQGGYGDGGNHDFPYLNNTVIYQPANGSSMIYPRYTELLDGTILVSVSYNSGNPDELPAFPVFSSSDGGASWDWISNITDQVNGWGMSAQPALLELIEDVAEFPAGTILAAGNSWSANGTHIDVYSSPDKGMSWKFVSNVAQGTAPNTTNGAMPIWEPMLMLYEGQIVCFYSDQRDPAYGQKLAHQVSDDVKTWGPVVNDVAAPTYADRPGMTIVTHLPDDTWMLVNEYPGGQSWGEGRYPVYYHIANSPLEFITDPGKPILANGYQPSSSPYVVWSSVGGPNGTIVVSDADHNGVFINEHLGAADQWRYKLTEAPAAYSRALAIWNGQPNKLGIISAASFNDAANNITSPVSISTIDLDGIRRQNPVDSPKPLQMYYPILGEDTSTDV